MGQEGFSHHQVGQERVEEARAFPLYMSTRTSLSLTTQFVIVHIGSAHQDGEGKRQGR